jgi:hypothetical protein
LGHAADTLECCHILHTSLLCLTTYPGKGLTKSHLSCAKRLAASRLLLSDLTKLPGELSCDIHTGLSGCLASGCILLTQLCERLA